MGLHSYEAEMGVLGSMLLSKSASLIMADMLKVKHFARPNHATIFSACTQLVASGTDIDPLTLKDALITMGELANVGGEEYILMLAEFVPSPANANDYAGIVIEKWQRRAIASLGNRLLHDASNGKLPHEAISECLLKFDEVLAADLTDLPTTTYGVDFEPEVYEHVWEPYIPKGRGVLFEAPPGAKKTSFAIGAIAAALAQGLTPRTFEPCDKVRTLFIHGYDDSTADVEAIFRANNGPPNSLVMLQKPGGWMLDEPGLAKLKRLVKSREIGLIIIDPLKLFLPHHDDYRDLDVLRVLSPIQKFWQELGIGFVAIRHAGKVGRTKDAKPVHERGLGSQAYFQCFRGLLCLRPHPDENKARRGIMVLTDEKGSLRNPKGEGFCFMRRGDEIEFLPNEPNPFDADTGDTRSKSEQCQEWLRETLTGSTCSLKYIIEQAEILGFSDSLVKQCRKALGVVSKGDKRGGGETVWLTIPDGSYQPYFDE